MEPDFQKSKFKIIVRFNIQKHFMSNANIFPSSSMVYTLFMKFMEAGQMDWYKTFHKE